MERPAEGYKWGASDEIFPLVSFSDTKPLRGNSNLYLLPAAGVGLLFYQGRLFLLSQGLVDCEALLTTIQTELHAMLELPAIEMRGVCMECLKEHFKLDNINSALPFCNEKHPVSKQMNLIGLGRYVVRHIHIHIFKKQYAPLHYSFCPAMSLRKLGRRLISMMFHFKLVLMTYPMCWLTCQLA